VWVERRSKGAPVVKVGLRNSIDGRREREGRDGCGWIVGGEKRR